MGVKVESKDNKPNKKVLIFIAGISLLVVFFAVIAALQKSNSGVLNKDIVFVVKNAHPVVFSHKAHCQKHKLKCGDCHYRQNIFPQAAKPLGITMQDIYNGKACGKCHNGKIAFSPFQNCARCHRPVDLNNLDNKNIIVIYEK